MAQRSKAAAAQHPTSAIKNMSLSEHEISWLSSLEVGNAIVRHVDLFARSERGETEMQNPATHEIIDLT